MHSAVKVWVPAVSVAMTALVNVAPGRVAEPSSARTVFASIRYLTWEIEDSASLADAVRMTSDHGELRVMISEHSDGGVTSRCHGGRSATAVLPARSVTSTEIV